MFFISFSSSSTSAYQHSRAAFIFGSSVFSRSAFFSDRNYEQDHSSLGSSSPDHVHPLTRQQHQSLTPSRARSTSMVLFPPSVLFPPINRPFCSLYYNYHQKSSTITVRIVLLSLLLSVSFCLDYYRQTPNRQSTEQDLYRQKSSTAQSLSSEFLHQTRSSTEEDPPPLVFSRTGDDDDALSSSKRTSCVAGCLQCRRGGSFG